MYVHCLHMFSFYSAFVKIFNFKLIFSYTCLFFSSKENSAAETEDSEIGGSNRANDGHRIHDTSHFCLKLLWMDIHCALIMCNGVWPDLWRNHWQWKHLCCLTYKRLFTSIARVLAMLQHLTQGLRINIFYLQK